MQRKIMAVLLAAFLFVSVFSTTALAAEVKPQIVSGGIGAAARYWKDADINNEAVGAGLAVGTDGIVASTKKYVEATGDENKFKITLEVVTSQTVTETTIPGDALVVLVLDVSGSMNRNERYTIDGKANQTRMAAAVAACKKFITNYANVGEYTSNEVVRGLAIVGFGTNAAPLLTWRNISGNAADANNSLNVLSTTANATPWPTVDAGTNMAAGLRYANNLLGAIPSSVSKNRAITNVHVILVSDGGPTCAIVSGNSTYNITTGTMGRTTSGNVSNSFLSGTAGVVSTGNSTLTNSTSVRGEGVANAADSDTHYKACVSVAVNEANLLKNRATNKPTIHSIGFTTQNFNNTQREYWAFYRSASDGLSVTNILKKVSSNDSVFDAADTLKLDSAFVTIYGSIATHPWVVTDKMGSNIIFNETALPGFASWSSELNSLTWDILSDAPVSTSTSGNTTLYTYRYSYHVILDNLNGYVANTDNATNGSTTLTYVVKSNGVTGHQRTAQFTSPVVKGFAGKLKFEKVNVKGDVLKGAKFGLWLAEGADPAGLVEINALKTATSGNDGIILFENIASGHRYYLKELVAPEGYKLDERLYVVTVSYGTVRISVADPTAESMFYKNS